MSTAIENARDQLLSVAAGDPQRAAALLDLVEQQRRNANWVRYWQPAGDQLQFWQQLHPDQKVWVVLGGNRSGKTELGAFLTTAWLLGKDFFRGELAWPWVEPLPIPQPPTAVRGVALNTDMLRDPLWEKLTGYSDHPPMFPAAQIASKSDHFFQVRFKNGSKFSGKSADPTVDPKTHGGVSLDFAWIDEECSKEFFDENWQRTVSRGGKLLITATPLSDIGTAQHPWLFDLVQDWRNGDKSIGVVFLSLFNNPYVPESEKESQRLKWRGHPEERARLYGDFVQRAGLVYPEWRPEPPLWIPPYDIPETAYRAVMIDPASSGPVAALWAAFDSKGKMTVYRAYKERNLTPSEHVANILALNGGDPIDLWLLDPYMGRERLPWSDIHGDKRTVLEVFRDAGLPRLRIAEVSAAVALEESREYLRAAFDPTSRHPACEFFNTLHQFRAEIERYVYDTTQRGPQRGEVRDRPRKGNDDLINAWQYLCGMRLRSRRPGTAKPIPPEFRSYSNQGPTELAVRVGGFHVEVH